MDEETKQLIIGMAKDIGTLKSDVGSLKSDVGTLKSDVGTLKFKVEGLDYRFDSLQFDLNSMRGEMETGFAIVHEQFEELTNHIDGLVKKNIPFGPEGGGPPARPAAGPR